MSMETNWLRSLPTDEREKTFAAMRAIDAEAQRRYAASRKLSPNAGETAVGGAHIDELAKAEGLAAFLRALRKGETPTAALGTAKLEAALVFSQWNKRRKDYQVHRSTESATSWLEWQCSVITG